MTLTKKNTALMTVMTAFVLGVMFAPVGYAQPHENVVVATNGLTFEKGERLSIIVMAENISNKPIRITDFKNEAAGVVGNCGIDYLNVALIKGSHTDVQNYEQLLALKDQYVNFEYKDSDTKLPCKGIDKVGINSVQLSEPTSVTVTQDMMSKRLMNLYFGTDNPVVPYSNVVVDYINANGESVQLEYALAYSKEDITEYYDTDVQRDSISPTETKVYRNVHEFTPGEYTIIGSTMSGSISEPVVITMQPNELSTSEFEGNVLYSIIGALLSSVGIVGATIATRRHSFAKN